MHSRVAGTVYDLQQRPLSRMHSVKPPCSFRLSGNLLVLASVGRWWMEEEVWVETRKGLPADEGGLEFVTLYHPFPFSQWFPRTPYWLVALGLHWKLFLFPRPILSLASLLLAYSGEIGTNASCGSASHRRPARQTVM